MPATITRTVVYQACAICARPRIGRGARGWPAHAEICPTCSATTRQAIAIGIDKLSPEPEPVEPSASRQPSAPTLSSSAA